METEYRQIQKRDIAKQLGKRVLIGALAGLIASIPMAGVMIGLERVLPKRKRSWWEAINPLPPKQVVSRLGQRAHLGRVTQPGKRWDLTTWLGHLGYGAAAASLYPVITRSLRIPAVLSGILFALGVWAGSYLGWLPAIGILPPATEQSPRRNAVMVLSHVSWGTWVGLLTRWFNQKL